MVELWLSAVCGTLDHMGSFVPVLTELNDISGDAWSKKLLSVVDMTY